MSAESLDSGARAALQALVDGLVWRACTPAYAAQVGPHEYVVRHKTCGEEPWAALREAIRRHGRSERYLVTGNTFTYLLLGEHRYWTAPGWAVINRARQADVADKYGPPSGTQKRSRKLKLSEDRRQVIDIESGVVHDVQEVIERLPWRHSVVTPPPCMPPHSYVMLGQCDENDWDVLAFVIRTHPESYLAYFRGYQHPMRYLEIGDMRYWRSSLGGKHFLNCCTLDSVEPPRRVDQGAKPRLDWDALHPWWPEGYWAPATRRLGRQS